MNICGKGNFPECEYFTTGGCVSPSNCIYKIKQDFNTRATSNAIEISRNAISRVVAENAELRHRAEVAERALLFLCDKTMSDISAMVFPNTKTQVANKQELYDYCIKQAEKEVEEEQGNGEKEI